MCRVLADQTYHAGVFGQGLAHDLAALRILAHAGADEHGDGHVVIGGRGAEMFDQGAQIGVGLALMIHQHDGEFAAVGGDLVAGERGQQPGLAVAIIDHAGLADARLLGDGIDAEPADADTAGHRLDGPHQFLAVDAALASHSGLAYFNTTVRK